MMMIITRMMMIRVVNIIQALFIRKVRYITYIYKQDFFFSSSILSS